MTKEEMEKFQEKMKLISKYQYTKDQIEEIIDKSRLARDKKKHLKHLIQDLLIIQSEIDTFKDTL